MKLDDVQIDHPITTATPSKEASSEEAVEGEEIEHRHGFHPQVRFFIALRISSKSSNIP